MKRIIAGAFIFLCLAFTLSFARASTLSLVVPRVYETNDSGAASSVLHHEIRLQNVYSSALFPPNKVLEIRELRYRPSVGWGGPFSTTVSNIQINLSTTPAVVDGLSATFANNVGSNDTVVFNGSIQLSSAFSGPAHGPKAFDIIIPLTTPFRYDPSKGNLLIDYRNRSGSGAANIDAGVGNGASRVFALGAGSTVATSVDQGAEVVQLIYTEREPESPPPGNNLVIPPAYWVTEGVGGSSLLRDALRLQNVYASGVFPANKVLVIRELRYRPSAIHGSAFSATISDLQINLSTTQKGVDGLSATFANNVGSNDTVVFNGSINLSSSFSGPAGGPKAFDIRIPLTTPFRYDPSKGNLLIDYRNRSGSGVTWIDSGVGNGASRVFALGAGSTVAAAVDQGAEVVQVIYTEEGPQPPPPALTFVIPRSATSNDTTYGGGVFVDPNLREQQVYGREEFPSGAVLIRELRYRPDRFYGSAFSTIVPNIQINMSTTQRSPSELSAVFAENTGANDTVVFQGALPLSSQFVGPVNGPKAFDMIVPLSQPFLYNPANGNLVIDVRNFSGSAATRVSGQTGPDNVRRVLGSTTASSGVTIDDGADAIQVVYSVVTNQPPPPPPTNGFDVQQSFSIAANPNGPWSYGYKETLTGTMGLLTTPRHLSADNGVQILSWAQGPTDAPAVYFNGTSSTAVVGSQAYPPGSLFFEVGWGSDPEDFGVIRLTVPAGAGGTYQLQTRARPHVSGPNWGDAHFYVLRNSTTLFDQVVVAQGSASYSNAVGLAAGDTVDFVIGHGPSGLPNALLLEGRLVKVSTNQPPPPPPPTNGFDVQQSFSIAANPNGPWSYGYKETLAGTMDLLTTPRRLNVANGVEMQSWAFGPIEAPTVYYNATTNTAVDSGGGVYPPGSLLFEVGFASEPENFGVVRLTVPAGAGGTYQLQTRARPHLSGPNWGDAHFYVLRNSTTLFDQVVVAQGSASYSNVVGLVAGDTVDFVIGRGPSAQPNAMFLEGTLVKLSTNQPPPTPETDHNLSLDFSLAGNPNGVWSYGRQEEIGGAFTLLGTAKTNFGNVPMILWAISPTSQPAILHNDTTETVISLNGEYPPETTWFHPGIAGQPGNYAVARLTVPAGGGGTYQLVTTARPNFVDSVQLDSDFHVARNNVEIFGAQLSGGQTAGYTNTLALAAGDTIDFAVGRGTDNSHIWSGLKIEATLEKVSTNQPPPPNSFDVQQSFSIAANPNGPWSYGYKGTLTGTMGLLTTPRHLTAGNGVPILSWAQGPADAPAVYYNGTTNTAIVGLVNPPVYPPPVYPPGTNTTGTNTTGTNTTGLGVYPPGTLYFEVGWASDPEDYGVIRLTVPAGAGGTYRLQTLARPHLSGSNWGNAHFYVLRNSTTLFDQVVVSQGSASYSNVVGLAAGDTVDFVIGHGPSGLPNALILEGTLVKVSTNQPLNAPPVASISVPLAIDLSPAVANLLVISVNGSNAVVALSGAGCSDPDGDNMSFAWDVDGVPAGSAQEQITTLGVGVHTIALTVSDGRATGTETIQLRVVTIESMVETLIALIDNGGLSEKVQNALIVVLEQVDQAFEHGHLEVAIRKLETFQERVAEQVLPLDSEFAESLISIAQQLIDAMAAAPPDARTFDPARDFSLGSNPNGAWSYGHKQTLTGTMGLLTTPRHLTAENGVEILSWALGPVTAPGVYYNPTTNTAITSGGLGVYPPGSLFFEVGWASEPENFGVIRLTVPAGAGGLYRLETSARPHLNGPNAGDSHFYVLKNSTTLFEQVVVAESTARYSELVTLAAGDTIDFVIGHGPSQLPNALKLQAQLVEVSRLRSEKQSSVAMERPGFSFNAGGGTYAIEVSSDLKNWTTLTNVVGATGSVKISDPESHMHPRRFYRTRLIR